MEKTLNSLVVLFDTHKCLVKISGNSLSPEPSDGVVLEFEFRPVNCVGGVVGVK